MIRVLAAACMALASIGAVGCRDAPNKSALTSPPAFSSCDGGGSNGVPTSARCGDCRPSCEAASRCRAGECIPRGQIAMSTTHACRLSPGGEVDCWGSNARGELGDGTTLMRSEAVRVKGISEVTQISLGSHSTCAVRRDGTLWCWGYLRGEGEDRLRLVPEKFGGVSDAVSVASNWEHSCAATRSGRVLCWGLNGDSQLGDGRNAPSATPVEVQGISDAVSVAVGDRFGCALRRAGGVRCWGKGSAFPPVEPLTYGIGNTESATQVVVDGFVGCVILSNRHVACWDNQREGSAVELSGLSDVTDLALFGAGHRLGLATRADGTIVTFKIPFKGHKTKPQEVDVLGGPAVAAAEGNACVLASKGRVVCWGSSQWGRLGTGFSSTHPSPVEQKGLGDVRAIVARGLHTVALTTSGALWHWDVFRQPTRVEVTGWSKLMSVWCGQRGTMLECIRSDNHQLMPAVRLTGIVSVDRFIRGRWYALRSDGRVVAIEWNWDPEGEDPPRLIDVPLPAPARSLLKLGLDKPCALLGETLVCDEGSKGWGPPRTLPAEMQDVRADSSFGYIGLTRSGKVMRWREDQPPVVMEGVDDATQLLGDRGFACVRQTSGKVSCWRLVHGRWGDSDLSASRRVGTVPGLDNAKQVVVGGGRVCGLRNDGKVRCWSPFEGPMRGDGSLSVTDHATEVPGLSDIKQIDAGDSHVCALARDGKVFCWGEGAAVGVSEPRRVSAPVDVEIRPF